MTPTSWQTCWPCCEQPTGVPIDNGYIHPRWKVARHICFNAWWECPACGDTSNIGTTTEPPEDGCFECDWSPPPTS